MQPIVPGRDLPNIVAASRSQSPRVSVQVREDTANIGRFEWQVNHRVWGSQRAPPQEEGICLDEEVLGLDDEVRHHTASFGVRARPRSKSMMKAPLSLVSVKITIQLLVHFISVSVTLRFVQQRFDIRICFQS